MSEELLKDFVDSTVVSKSKRKFYFYQSIDYECVEQIVGQEQKVLPGTNINILYDRNDPYVLLSRILQRKRRQSDHA